MYDPPSTVRPTVHPAHAATSQRREKSDASTGAATLPIRVPLPDLRPGAAVQQTAATEGSAEHRLRSYDAVDTALGVESTNEQAEAMHAKAAGRPRVILHDATQPTYTPVTEIRRQPRNLAASPRSSLRSVVILILVLLSAAGLTFWITYGGNHRDNTSSDGFGGPPALDEVPHAVCGAPFDNQEAASGSAVAGTSDIGSYRDTGYPSWTSPGAEILLEQRVQAEAPQPHGSQYTPYIIGVTPVEETPQFATSSPGERVAEQPQPATCPSYPQTSYPDDWLLPEIPVPSANPIMPPPTSGTESATPGGEFPSTESAGPPEGSLSVRQSSAPVSFVGTLETPNLRARHDQQQSSIH